ncbi:MAG: galactokinase [Bacteroidota bacterium]
MNIKDLKTAFFQRYGQGDASISGELHTFFAPGRVNLIGEHIDYNGGFVFPAALTIGITAIARRRQDNTIRLYSLNTEQEVLVDTLGEMNFEEKDGWGNYPKGVFQFLSREGYELGGYDIMYWGDLPDGAGLSSSAAIEVLTTFMMLTLESEKTPVLASTAKGGEPIDRVWLSKFCQQVENRYIGVNSGIMDQFCVALGKKDHAILLNTDTLAYEYVPFQLKGYSLVIMNTNHRRELADSKYNERRAECDQALAILNDKYQYRDLCSASLEAVEELIQDETLRKRAIHVITENQRVIQAIDVLKQGDLVAFGQLLNQSHHSLQEDYAVTGTPLDALAHASQQQPGCLGARMTGAGFGGCAIALVKNENVEAFKKNVSAIYSEKTGLKADFYPSQIGEGVYQSETFERQA